MFQENQLEIRICKSTVLFEGADELQAQIQRKLINRYAEMDLRSRFTVTVWSYYSKCHSEYHSHELAFLHSLLLLFIAGYSFHQGLEVIENPP